MCAECHDHKFDPYTQKDFYSVAAFFADIQEPAVGGRGPGTPVPTPGAGGGAEARRRDVAAAQAKLDAAAKAFAADADAFADVEKWPNPNAKKGPATVVVPADVKAILAKKPEARRRPRSRLADVRPRQRPELKADRDALAAATKAKTDFENTVPRVLIDRQRPAADGAHPAARQLARRRPAR